MSKDSECFFSNLLDKMSLFEKRDRARSWRGNALIRRTSEYWGRNCLGMQSKIPVERVF
jgi:hypothetical protein